MNPFDLQLTMCLSDGWSGLSREDLIAPDNLNNPALAVRSLTFYSSREGNLQARCESQDDPT